MPRYHCRLTVARIAFVAVLASCLILAAQPMPQARSGSGKAPWLWTTEERIAKRVDPAERDARRSRALQTARQIAPGFSPIDGSIEPELFLPVELVTRLVLRTDAPNERWRERYRAAIASHGWEYEHFWDVLHAAAAPYLSLMEQTATLQRQKRGRVDVGQLQPQICAVSVDLLDTAYKTFGKQKFDEFLYRSVAPPIRSFTASYADSADALRAKSRGCR